MIGLPKPKTWSESPLGEVAEIERASVTAQNIETGTKYVGLEHLDSEGRILAVQTVNNGDLASNKFAFGPKHILYGKLRPYLRKIVRPDFDGVCSTDILPIRATKVDRGYLFHYLRHPRVVEYATGRCEGANLPRISPSELEKFPVHFPPLPEQRRIADILDKADAIRRKRQEAVAVVDSLISSEFQARFGDPVTNTHSRKTVPISAYGRVTTGNTPSRKEEDNYGNAIEWIKSDNINTPRHWLTRSTEGLSEKGLAVARTVPPGSILVTCIAGSPSCVGNAAMADRTVAFNQQINAITPSEHVDPFFLYALILLSKPLIQRSSTESMKGMVSKGKFEQVQVIEADPQEQTEYGKVLQKILALLDRQYAGDQESGDLFNSLVQRAFRGEL